MFDLMPFRSDAVREIDDFERRFFGRPLPAFRTDVRETETDYILEAELPGFAKEEVRATVKNNLLTISAEQTRIREENNEKNGYIRRERSRGSFCRSFDITGVRTEGIRAVFENGILTLTLPKQEHPKDAPRELEIQ